METNNQSLILSAFKPDYLPSLEYFWKMAQCHHAMITDHFQYVKRSSLTVSAPLHRDEDRLHIPVRHDYPQKSIAQKTLDDTDNWRKKHYSTIYHLFHHLPFEYYYLPALKDFYVENYCNLADFQWRLLHLLVSWLNLPIQLHRSSQIKNEGSNEGLIRHWCAEFSCNYYYAEQDVFQKNWVNTEKLTEAGIHSAVFHSFPESHLFQSYQKLSALSFLMKFGPEAGFLIRQYLPTADYKFNQ